MIQLRSQARRMNTEDLDTFLRIEAFQPGRIEQGLDTAMPRRELDEQMIKPQAARRFSDVKGHALTGTLDNGELGTRRTGKDADGIRARRAIRAKRSAVGTGITRRACRTRRASRTLRSGISGNEHPRSTRHTG